jgi:DNA-binding response OmpR family regulator
VVRHQRFTVLVRESCGVEILIVDDDPDMVEAGRIVLEREGYSVESAPNLEDGLLKLAETSPDLLILDV